MKYLFSMVLLIIVCACSKKEVKKEPFPFIEVKENEWTVYEGKIITQDNVLAAVELSLKENTVGVESDYKLKGVALTETEAVFNMSHGKFNVTYGLADNAMGIEIEARNTGKLMTSTIITHSKNDRKRIMSGAFEPQNIYFITNGGEQLILSNDDFSPIAQDNRYTLYKRSNLFTAEGYLTIAESNPEFFERNTSENWKVARLGVYTEIDSTYKKLSTMAYEGIYLKALAYSVADTSDAGDPIRKLVVKRILEMNVSH